MKIRNGVILIVAAQMVLSACSATGPSTASAWKLSPKLARAQSDDAAFFMTVPIDTTASQTLEIKAVETAYLSIAAVDADLPLANWTKLGWKVGQPLDATEDIPQDCALHFRTGIAQQAYATCIGPAKVGIPQQGGDFVYMVFTDTNHQIARIMQTGDKYNPDITGLIP